MTILRLSTLAFLTASLASAGVIRNSPGACSGFYNGNSNYFSNDGTGFLNGLSASLLTDTNVLASHKVWGTSTLGASNFPPYIVMVADGSATGSFTVDTNVFVRYNFSIPNLGPSLPFAVHGALNTSNGSFYIEEKLFNSSGGVGQTALLKKDGSGTLLPAGTEVFS